MYNVHVYTCVYMYNTTCPAVCMHTVDICTSCNGVDIGKCVRIIHVHDRFCHLQSNTNQSQGNYFRRKWAALGGVWNNILDWVLYCFTYIILCTYIPLVCMDTCTLFRSCNYYRFRLRSRVAVIPCASPPPQGDSRSTRDQTVRETLILSSMAEEGMCLCKYTVLYTVGSSVYIHVHVITIDAHSGSPHDVCITLVYMNNRVHRTPQK